jgi:ubiquinone/menaquinone biosynthesis C-methylase UbiE
MANQEYKNPISKYVHEYMYWRKQVDNYGPLKNDHYEEIFTTLFEVEKSFYDDLKILDMGCGPRGSLEWADNAAQRVGLDPLAEAYQFLINGSHAMEYTPDFAESISFDDNHFDILTSINSLDHVDKSDEVIAEMKRVVKPGGHIFITVEVCQHKKYCEPSPVNWKLAKKFTDACDIIDEKHYTYENGVAHSIKAATPYNHDAPQTESGVLRLKLKMR